MQPPPRYKTLPPPGKSQANQGLCGAKFQPIPVKNEANTLCEAEDAPNCGHGGKVGWDGGT